MEKYGSVGPDKQSINLEWPNLNCILIIMMTVSSSQELRLGENTTIYDGSSKKHYQPHNTSI